MNSVKYILLKVNLIHLEYQSKLYLYGDMVNLYCFNIYIHLSVITSISNNYYLSLSLVITKFLFSDRRVRILRQVDILLYGINRSHLANFTLTFIVEGVNNKLISSYMV